jgi:hypothetical protein
MSLAAMVAGAPFFLADGEGEGVVLGVSPASGDSVGLEEGAGDSAGVGVGDGECLRFFLGDGLGEESEEGVGEDFFFFFGEGDASGSAFSTGVGLTEDFFFFLDEEGDGDFSGVADGFGVGVFSASSFFLETLELLRCFRGAGVGVGAKIFLILLPNDSSACPRSGTTTSITIKKRALAILLTRRMERESSTGIHDE